MVSEQVFDPGISEQVVAVRKFFNENADATNNPIRLPNISGKQLTELIGYLTDRFGFQDLGDAGKEKSEKYDAEFLDQKSNEDLKELLMAAKYLVIKLVLDLLCQAFADRIKNRSVEFVKDLLDQVCDKVADMIKGKKPEEIRAIFKIENEFAPEEEEKDETQLSPLKRKLSRLNLRPRRRRKLSQRRRRWL